MRIDREREDCSIANSRAARTESFTWLTASARPRLILRNAPTPIPNSADKMAITITSSSKVKPE